MGTSTWTRIVSRNYPPTARELASLVLLLDDSMIVLFGGISGVLNQEITSVMYNDTNLFDFNTLNWYNALESDAYSPECLNVCWGTTMSQTSTSTAMLITIVGLFSLSTVTEVPHRLEWTRRDHGDFPPRMLHAAMVADFDALYVFGGITNHSIMIKEQYELTQGTNDLWLFNVSTGVWSEIFYDPASVVPSPRYGHQCVVLGTEAGTRLACYGGLNGDMYTAVPRDPHVYLFSTMLRRWEVATSINNPPPNTYFGMTVHRDDNSMTIFTFGGTLFQVQWIAMGVTRTITLGCNPGSYSPDYFTTVRAISCLLSAYFLFFLLIFFFFYFLCHSCAIRALWDGMLKSLPRSSA